MIEEKFELLSPYEQIVYTELARIIETTEKCNTVYREEKEKVTLIELTHYLSKYILWTSMVHLLDTSENKKGEELNLHPRHRISFHNLATQVDIMTADKLNKEVFGIGSYLQPYVSYCEYDGLPRLNTHKKEMDNLESLSFNLFMRPFITSLQKEADKGLCSHFLSKYCKLTTKEIAVLKTKDTEEIYLELCKYSYLHHSLTKLVAFDNVYLPYVSLVMNRKDKYNFVEADIFVEQLIFYFEKYSLQLPSMVAKNMKAISNKLINN